ncbi:MAG: 50S ribosomal protein L25 [Candidatus Eremiobacteraeota bacterium]|nr:50S ribosomal protein L25 [Candidatus Eremiobacteraeota bacterium]
MASKDLNLTLEKRDHSGTTTANALRATGKVPGVLYGHGAPPQPITFDGRAFEDLLHKGARTGLITLTLGGKKDTALLREVQRDPVSRKIMHADLQRVSATENVHTTLSVVTVGVAIGVKEYGGVLDLILHEVEVSGPANKLPEHLEIDVTDLGIGDHITAAEMKLPDGFKMLTAPDMNVVAVAASKTAAQVEESAVPAEQVAPEVIGAKPEADAPKS